VVSLGKHVGACMCGWCGLQETIVEI